MMEIQFDRENREGYFHPFYADSLSEWATPLYLPHSQGWVLERSIPDSSFLDVMGLYPRFVCQNWELFAQDLAELKEKYVCFSLVTDAFNPPPYSFQADVYRLFKHHFIVDLTVPLHQIISPHHLHYAQKALTQVQVEQCQNPLEWLDEWIKLYHHLITYRQLKGLSVFSSVAFKKQFQVPGLIVLRATYEEETVGMHLWYSHEKRAYSHLAAFNQTGYSLMASYALYYWAMDYFAKQGYQCLDLGAGAGLHDHKNGLSWFKKGWSNQILPVYLCGWIFQPLLYQQLSEHVMYPLEDFFPRYR